MLKVRPSLFRLRLCLVPIFASLVIHGFDPSDSLIEDPVCLRALSTEYWYMQMKRAIVLRWRSNLGLDLWAVARIA